MIGEDAMVDLIRQALVIALKISAPILLAGILIGLIISIFQSITQIQEQSLSLVPKIFVMTIVAIMLMRWIAMRLGEFASEMFSNLL